MEESGQESQAPSAQNTNQAMPKTDKPNVELFVMSYCPYGLQMEKAYLPVMDLLKGKADMDVKFVSYAMHGQKEVEENTLQYCIQKEQNAKFTAYLSCFAASGDSASCLSSSGVNANALNTCVTRTNNQFGIMKKFNDQSTWLSGQYPVYPIHERLNSDYNVQGSPTLVINGQDVEVGRSPEAVKQAICAGFNNPPAECEQGLGNYAYVPSFGTAFDTGAGGAAGCAT